MKSIKRRFEIFKMKYGSHTDYVIFGRAIEGQGFTGDMIGRWLPKLVTEEESGKVNKKCLVAQLVERSKVAVDNSFRGVKGSTTIVKVKEVELHQENFAGAPKGEYHKTGVPINVSILMTTGYGK